MALLSKKRKIDESVTEENNLSSKPKENVIVPEKVNVSEKVKQYEMKEQTIKETITTNRQDEIENKETPKVNINIGNTSHGIEQKSESKGDSKVSIGFPNIGKTEIKMKGIEEKIFKMNETKSKDSEQKSVKDNFGLLEKNKQRKAYYKFGYKRYN